MALNAQQHAFVDGILEGKNASEAYRAAGYACKKSALAASASRLLSDANVQAEIDRRRAKIAAKVEFGEAEIMAELFRLARVDVSGAFDDDGNLLSIKKMPEDVRRAICAFDVETRAPGLRLDRNGEVTAPEGGTVVTKVRFWDKKGALELLGKRFKMWVEKHEHSGKDGAPIQVQVITGVPAAGDPDPSDAPVGEA